MSGRATQLTPERFLLFLAGALGLAPFIADQTQDHAFIPSYVWWSVLGGVTVLFSLAVIVAVVAYYRRTERGSLAELKNMTRQRVLRLLTCAFLVLFAPFWCGFAMNVWARPLLAGPATATLESRGKVIVLVDRGGRGGHIIGPKHWVIVRTTNYGVLKVPRPDDGPLVRQGDDVIVTGTTSWVGARFDSVAVAR